MKNLSHVLQGCKETGIKTGRNYRKNRCLNKHKEKEHKHLNNSPACKFEQNELQDKVGKMALFDKRVLSLAQSKATN